MISQGDWVTVKQYASQQAAYKDAKHTTKAVAYTIRLSGAAVGYERAEVIAVHSDKSVNLMFKDGQQVADLGWLELSPVYNKGDRVVVKPYSDDLELRRSYPHDTLGKLNNIVTLGNLYSPSKWLIHDMGIWICNSWISGLYGDTDVSEGPIVCACDLSSGCSCGAFKAEMLAKGRIYDDYLRCYVSK